MDEARLERIETKLDKLSDAIVSIVRVEERIIALFKKIEVIDERLSKLETRINEVEQLSTARGAVYRLLDKFAWIAVGGLAVMLIEGSMK